MRYPGLKEEYYLADFEPDERVLGELGVEPGRILCVLRTAPSYALYLGGAESALPPRILRRLVEDERTQTVVLACNDEQRRAVRELGLERVLVPERAVDGRSLVAFADLPVSAGGTMNREAAVLGTPVWSIFEGRLGAVDEQLAREGRLRFLSDPSTSSWRRSPRPRGGTGSAAIQACLSVWPFRTRCRTLRGDGQADRARGDDRRPAADVFAYVTDFSRVPEWQATAIEGRLESERMEQGARAFEVRKVLGRELESTLTIVEYADRRGASPRRSRRPLSYRVSSSSSPTTAARRFSSSSKVSPAGSSASTSPWSRSRSATRSRTTSAA